MNFFKWLVAIVSLATLSACGTTSSTNEEGVTTKATTSQIEELETKVGDRVFFEYDSPVLTTEAEETLRKQAAFMDQNRELTFIIEGHADERGTREYNIGLGERRANAVKQFLSSLGISQNRLTVVSFGKERPAVVGSNDWSWSQNRRAVTVAQ